MTTTMLAGQVDLFGAITQTVPAAAPVSWVRALPLATGEIRYTRSGAQRDCDDCWADQAAASRAGLPVPFRRRTAYLRRTVTTSTYLCEPHKATRQDAEVAR